VTGTLGLAQGLDEGLIANPVEFARHNFKADVGHC
jgi:hypothetical protein